MNHRLIVPTLGFALLALAGCGGQPIQYQAHNEMMPGPGLFSGDSGVFSWSPGRQHSDAGRPPAKPLPPTATTADKVDLADEAEGFRRYQQAKHARSAEWLEFVEWQSWQAYARWHSGRTPAPPRE